MEGDLPAEGGAVANAEPVRTETPSAVAVQDAPATSETASKPTEQPSPSTPEPDLTALLKDPKVRQQLLRDPEMQREIDHRASSEAGRRAKAQLENWQQQQAREYELRRQEAEIAELEQLDEFEVGTRTKQQLAERRQRLAQQRQEEVLRQQIQPLRQQLEVETYQKAGTEVFATVFDLAKESGATESELDKLNPANYASLGEYIKGSVEFLSSRKGQKLAKEMAKTEAAAMLEDQAAVARDGAPAPAVLPAGNGARAFTRADLANMSPEEYRRNQDRIWEQMGRR